MKTTVSEHDFIDAFRRYGRMDNFSVPGLRALFEHLEQLEQDIGEELELDVIAICCDYSEHSSATEAAEEYGWTRDDEHDDEEAEESAMAYLRDNTDVVEVDGGRVIIRGF